jgi:hypothetical protein
MNTSFNVPHKKYHVSDLANEEARISCLLFCYQKYSLNSAVNSEIFTKI